MLAKPKGDAIVVVQVPIVACQDRASVRFNAGWPCIKGGSLDRFGAPD